MKMEVGASFITKSLNPKHHGSEYKHIHFLEWTVGHPADNVGAKDQPGCHNLDSQDPTDFLAQPSSQIIVSKSLKTFTSDSAKKVSSNRGPSDRCCLNSKPCQVLKIRIRAVTLLFRSFNKASSFVLLIKNCSFSNLFSSRKIETSV